MSPVLAGELRFVMTWRRGVDAEAARPQIVRSWRGLRAAKNGLLARFIRCVKERRRWRRHPISREAASERRMIACPSGGFRVQPRKYYFFWTAKGRAARERGDGERGHPLDPFIHCWATRTACARVCQEQAREMDRWTMQKTEGGRERNK